MSRYVEYADEQGVRAKVEIFGGVLPFRAAQHGATVPDGPLLAGISGDANITLSNVAPDADNVVLKNVGTGTTALFAVDPNGFEQPIIRADVLGVGGGALVLTGHQSGGFFYQEEVAPETTENRLTFFRAGEVEIPDTSLKLGRSNQRASFAGQ